MVMFDHREEGVVTSRVMHMREKLAAVGCLIRKRGGVCSSFFSWNTFCLIVIGLSVLTLSTKGLTNSGTFSLQGDMPRYLMNGVFFHDSIQDFPFSDPIQYVKEYYVRYPALTLGHHPLLPSLAEVPFFFLFGISVFSAKATTLAFVFLGIFAWFELVKTLYNSHIAFLSSLLFLTSPMIVEYSRVMMSEIPALALIIVATYWFFRYCKNERPHEAFGYVLCFVLACYAKQMVIFMFPIFFVYLGVTKGIRFLMKQQTIMSCLAIIILLIPLAVMTWTLSPANVSMVTQNIVKPLAPQAEEVEKGKEGIFQSVGSYIHWKLISTEWLFYPTVLWKKQVSVVPLVLSVGAVVMMVWRREKRSLYFFLWIMAMYGMVTFMGMRIPRLGIYWIPPVCLFAALSLEAVNSPVWRVVVALLLIGSVGYQFGVGYASEPEYAKGYEEAASYVVNHSKGASVLYSAKVDTGYFIFFVRKFDPEGRLVVLRADKVLSTSRLDRIVEEKISTPGELYDVLRDFGTCYVVLEEGHYTSPALNLLAEEVQSEQFIRKHTISIDSNNRRLQGVNLGIFEYRGCGPPNKNALVNFNIPLANLSIRLKFSDVID